MAFGSFSQLSPTLSGRGWPVALVFGGTLLLLVACDPFATGSVGVSVIGSVVNTSGRGVDGATVELSGGGEVVRAKNVETDGRYVFDGVEKGSYTLRYQAPGYSEGTLEVDAQETRRLGADTLIGPAVVRGTVVDAQSGEAVSGARVALAIEPESSGGSATASSARASQNSADPGAATNPDFVAETDDSGSYEISGVPTGTGSQVIEGDGYFEASTMGMAITEGENAMGPTSIPRELEGDGFRIVLEWGETPPDLDAHLTGPNGRGERFHVAYFRKEPSGVEARLEEDVGSGFGPETITIQDTRDGIYRYSIHNFSDRSRDGATGISTAQVRIYDSEGEFATYTPPPASSGDGNAWRVFEIIATEGDLTIDDGGGDTLGFFFAAGSDDVTTFSLSKNAGKSTLPRGALEEFHADMH